MADQKIIRTYNTPQSCQSINAKSVWDIIEKIKEIYATEEVTATKKERTIVDKYTLCSALTQFGGNRSKVAYQWPAENMFTAFIVTHKEVTEFAIGE